MRKLFVALTSVVALATTACSNSTSSDSTLATSTSSVPSNSDTKEITITIGENSGTDVVTEVTHGQKIKVTFLNDSADDEIHIHGYDLSTGEMKKGVAASITFTANKTGEFEMESHVTETVVQILKVLPS